MNLTFVSLKNTTQKFQLFGFYFIYSTVLQYVYKRWTCDDPTHGKDGLNLHEEGQLGGKSPGSYQPNNNNNNKIIIIFLLGYMQKQRKNEVLTSQSSYLSKFLPLKVLTLQSSYLTKFLPHKVLISQSSYLTKFLPHKVLTSQSSYLTKF